MIFMDMFGKEVGWSRSVRNRVRDSRLKDVVACGGIPHFSEEFPKD
jgi:hypothetical protein